MKISIEAFEANKGFSLNEQFLDCLQQINFFSPVSEKHHTNIVSMNLFLSEAKTAHFNEQKTTIQKALPENFQNIPIAFLPQPPASGAFVSVELWYLKDPEKASVSIKQKGGNKYILVEKEGHKMVIANGLVGENGNKNLSQSTESVFLQMAGILESEGLNFNHIVRQWNYIEDITFEYGNHVQKNQNYQVFNNIRSKYYSKVSFENGYPAATGIGINNSNVIISFIAASDAGFQKKSIENSFQKSAYDYSEKVLVGKTEYEGLCKCTPKFSRAKYFANQESGLIFISGTASIRDEVTIGENDIVQQTKTTIENIENLISEKTLLSNGISYHSTLHLDFIRVYIKLKKDYSKVREICEKKLPGVKAVYVISDICRENLLVEIEAIASE